ncbi:hypothetical protein M2322_002678 [Rhodoblastus acidophilus]|uniref:ATP-binding protein n=1 Tax=Rhodoblastus acidophilus TaxID=1074 RepID=UPI002224B13A|nr:ATP-binding protein [Rhodoblastus acidophilus]MCW2317124.1 hypothetical protein [Rhodoblastus acidophilus]
MIPLKVINLWAGPGAGKSTAAAGLFHLMKHEGYAVELVTEYAKDLTYERNWALLNNQRFVTREQDRRLRRLQGQAEWAITDSPLPLGLVYAEPNTMDLMLWGLFEDPAYQNFNVWVERNKLYSQLGRTQTEDEAKALDVKIAKHFGLAHGPHLMTPGDPQAPYRILAWLKSLGHQSAQPTS